MTAYAPLPDGELLKELRSAPRLSAFLFAFLEVEGQLWPVRLRNISSAGVLVEAEANLPVGTKLVFKRGPATIACRVIWSRSGRCGLAFETRISEQDVARLSRRIA